MPSKVRVEPMCTCEWKLDYTEIDEDCYYHGRDGTMVIEVGIEEGKPFFRTKLTADRIKEAYARMPPYPYRVSTLAMARATNRSIKSAHHSLAQLAKVGLLVRLGPSDSKGYRWHRVPTY